jgi:hypothetical protein
MNPTQKSLGERMDLVREDLLCNALDAGGKCLENESVAFRKKILCLDLD